MILNKSAVDRGLAHGTIFKTETVNLKDDKGKSQVCPVRSKSQYMYKLQ